MFSHIKHSRCGHQCPAHSVITCRRASCWVTFRDFWMLPDIWLICASSRPEKVAAARAADVAASLADVTAPVIVCKQRAAAELHDSRHEGSTLDSARSAVYSSARAPLLQPPSADVKAPAIVRKQKAAAELDDSRLEGSALDSASSAVCPFARASLLQPSPLADFTPPAIVRKQRAAAELDDSRLEEGSALDSAHLAVCFPPSCYAFRQSLA